MSFWQLSLIIVTVELWFSCGEIDCYDLVTSVPQVKKQTDFKFFLKVNILNILTNFTCYLYIYLSF